MIAEIENKAYMYDYRDDMKIHKQRVLTFKENLVKAYVLSNLGRLHDQHNAEPH
jgi:hypothetical protein